MVNEKKLVDLKEGESFTGYLLVDKVEFLKTKTNKDFASVDFADDTKKINAKIWDVSEENFDIKSRDIVEVVAKTTSFAGNLQLSIEKIEKIPEDSPFNDPYLFTKKAPISVEDMKKELNRFYKIIKDENINYSNIILNILKKDTSETMENSFFTQPAAKMVHHNYMSGLLYHTYRMLQTAEKIVSVYPFLNKALLYSAVILHDTGKMVELTGIEGTDYSERGLLLGHISIGDSWICEEATKLGLDPERDEDIVLLRHLVLSHHGKQEWGSPVSPKVPEAAVLHAVDKLDAELAQYEEAYISTNPGEKSSKVFGLGGEIYRAKGNKNVLK